MPINGLINDWFAAKTSCDVRRTFKTKRRKGEFISSFASGAVIDKRPVIRFPQSSSNHPLQRVLTSKGNLKLTSKFPQKKLCDLYKTDIFMILVVN